MSIGKDAFGLLFYKKKLRQGTCSRYADKLHKNVDKVHVVNMLITYIKIIDKVADMLIIYKKNPLL